MWSKLKHPVVYAIIFPVLGFWIPRHLIEKSDSQYSTERSTYPKDSVTLIVLGTVQDGGSPHIGCTRNCCSKLFEHPDPTRLVVSLGLADHSNNQSWMIEAGPDFSKQVYMLSQFNSKSNHLPTGILITHAHIGHYSGLMYLGREAMNSISLPVYTQPRMKHFIETNGPWNQLVQLNNIKLFPPDSIFNLSESIRIRSIPVPHRDEYSETVAYWIEGPHKKALFLPDIDKWEKWDRDIRAMISQIDYAFLDATFFRAAEVNNRDIKEIPHPLVIESLDYFRSLSSKDKNKIYFIHLNHTNPLLDPLSVESREVETQGFHVGRAGMKFTL